MNPDKLKRHNLTELQKNELLLTAQIFEAEHEADHAVMSQVGEALELEGQYAVYRPRLDEAYELHLEMEQAFSLLNNREAESELSEAEVRLIDAIREKNKAYTEIKDEIVAVLAGLGYGLEEETEVSPEVESQSVPESPIEKLVGLYRNADPSVLIDNVYQGRVINKRSKVVHDEIESVLNHAGYNSDKIKIFLNESVRSIRSEIQQKTRQQSETSDRALKQELRAKIAQSYQDLLDKVADFMREEKVNEVENTTNAEVLSEVEGDIDQSIASAVQKFELFKESGADTEDESFLQAKKAAEGLAQLDENDPAVAANKKVKYLRILTAALAKLDSVTTDILLDVNENTSQRPQALLEYAGKQKTQEFLDENIMQAVDEGITFYQALPNEFINSSTLIADLDKAVEGLNAAAKEQDLVVRKELVTRFKTALEQVRAEYVNWQSDSLNQTNESEEELKSEPEVTVGAKVKHNEALFNAKREFREKQQAYKAALSDFYEQQKSNSTLRSRVGGGLKKIIGLGINPELPPALMQMQSEYRAIRAIYAKSLDAALTERQNRLGYFKLEEGSNNQLIEKKNNAYSLDTDKAKIAFGKKFILKPNQEIAALQEQSTLSPEMQARLGRVLETMAKHKWAARIGMVTAAGIVGGLSGGAGLILAGAGFQASKMLASAGAGVVAGYGAKRLTQFGVDKASDAFDAKTKDFNLENLDAFETELLKAEADIKSAKTTQKVATIGAAVIAGGTTGYGLAAADFDGMLPSNRTGLSQESVARIVDQELAAAEPIMPVAPATENVQVAEVVPTAIENFSIAGIRVPLYGFSGNLEYSTVLSDIKINGAFSNGALLEADRLSLEQFIAESTNDLLAAHPNISEAKLEAELLSKVQGKFASAPWFATLGIKSIDIGSITVEPVGGKGVSLPLETSETSISDGTRVDVSIGDMQSSYTEASSIKAGTEIVIEKPDSTYVVQKGDTLSEIVEKRFEDQLKNIPAEKRGVLVEQLLKNIETDSTLRESIGMRSGDIDLIYANEKLNLGGVETELVRLLEREQVFETVRTSGPLSVQADVEVKTVPITVVEKPISVPPAIPQPVEVTAASGRVYTEVPSTIEKLETPVAPRPNALNGQYAEHPDYKAFIEKSFESRKAFEQIVEKSALNFDNKTYDVFERPGFFGGAQYESPYRFLGEMSLEELDEFATQPNSEIRAFLKENNIKYDTYLAWREWIDVMKNALPNQPNTTVTDLFQRYVAETLVPNANPLIKKP